jgi:activating signal cointegrator complex subunit 3
MLGRGGCVQFVTSLKDNLNAEVVLGTVTNVREASAWLGYTYLFVRMLKNPLVYGMSWEEVNHLYSGPPAVYNLF